MGKMDVKDVKVKTALDHVRSAAQELHGAMSDAASKRGDAMKADLQVISQKAKALTDSVKGSMGAQNEVAKKDLAGAVTYLQSTQKNIGESLKSSGKAYQDSFRKALADARASVQKVTDAVAATRSAATTQTRK